MELKEKRSRLEKYINDTRGGSIRPSLPEEIVMYEILPRVPVKSLFRFKLVSKKWCFAISEDSNFQRLQSRKCLIHPPGLLYFKVTNNVVWKDNKSMFFPTIGRHLAGMPDPSLKHMNIGDGHLRSSSNGLICGSYNCDRKRYYYVSNPITRECVTIRNTNETSDVAIAFDAVNGNSAFFLVSRNAKIIPGGSSKRVTEIGFTLFSSKTGMWSRKNAKVRTSKYYGSYFVRIRSVFTGGKLYWELGKEVLWFDIKKDSAGVVAVPNEAEKFPTGMIGNCDGELSYSMISTKTLNIEIWFLKSGESKDGKFEWVKKYFLNLRSIFEMKGISHGFNSVKKRDVCSLIQVLPFEGGDMVMFWVGCIEEIGYHIIFLYNIKSGSLEWVLNSGMRSGDVVISYKSSLVSVPTLPSVHVSGLIPPMYL
ncbi:hypothetical protein ACHQM5_017764 [Ranunculus cassubicifolius]